jgi:NAD(P)H-hydrate repair Nnr-like enzyme with NAD(P)H-hydrate dehydratase domain
MWIQKARANQILLHDAVSQQQEREGDKKKREKVTWAAGSSTRASAYTRRRSCLATAATGPSVTGAVLSHLAHNEVRPQEMGAAAATAAHLGSRAATIVNLGSGAVSATHLGSSIVVAR